jgi:radial spoke head protein 9
LKINQAKIPENYLHLRAPEQESKKILIESDKALECFNFMDSIESDKIKKSWSIQSDESGTEITVRSLLWPGYIGYHRTNSNIFGGVYMGHGIQVYDLAFLL